MSGYLTLKGQTEITNVIERSKFICTIKSVENEEEAKEFIEEIRKKHSLATHNCYAYVADEMGLIQKFSDDGEPQGTAGLPMLNVLKNVGLKKVACVVTRYFGGIKLGAGGLVRAYSGAVSDCIKNAQIFEMTRVVFLELQTDYEGYSKLDNLLTKLNVPKVDLIFDNDVKVKVAVKVESQESEREFTDKLLDVFKGKDLVKSKEYGYFAFKVENGKNH